MFRRYRSRRVSNPFSSPSSFVRLKNWLYRSPPEKRALLIIFGLVALVVLWLLSGFLHPEKNPNQLKIQKVASIQILPLKQGYTHKTIVSAGILEGQQTVTLKAEIAGRIRQVFETKGRRVSKGTPLVAIYSQGQKEFFENAKTNLEVAKSLEKEGLVSQAELREAAAGFAKAKEDYRKSVIRAPFNGIFDPADTIKAEDTVSPGQSLGRFSTLANLEAHFEIGERYAGSFAKGVSASLELLNGKKVKGKVSWVSQTADPQTHMISAKVRLASHTSDWRPGLSVSIKVQTPTQKAYFIPFGAAMLSKNNKPIFRFLTKDHKVISSPVTVFEKEDRGVWTKSVPKTAAYVIVLGQDLVEEGQTVKAFFIRKDLKKPDALLETKSNLSKH